MPLKRILFLSFAASVLAGAEPLPTPSDRGVSDVPISGRPMSYPIELAQAGLEGGVDVECDVDVDGPIRNCQTVTMTGDERFAAAAQDYVRGQKFLPAVQRGKPICLRHRWHFDFRLRDGRPDPSTSVPVEIVPLGPDEKDMRLNVIAAPPALWPLDLLLKRQEGSATIDCYVSPSGKPKDCRVIGSSGGGALAAAALEHVSQAVHVYEPRNDAETNSNARWTVTFGLLPGEPRVEDGVLPMRQVEGRPRLVYPMRTMSMSREGHVDVDCTIGLDGYPKDCRAANISGGMAFADSALEYVRKLRFAPELRNGVPVEAQHVSKIDFKLSDGSEAVGPQCPLDSASGATNGAADRP